MTLTRAPPTRVSATRKSPTSTLCCRARPTHGRAACQHPGIGRAAEPRRCDGTVVTRHAVCTTLQRRGGRTGGHGPAHPSSGSRSTCSLNLDA